MFVICCILTVGQIKMVSRDISTTSLKIAWVRIILPNLCFSVDALESRYLSYDSS